jgi:predicted RNA-binding Zn-ribbon protein involved in translation (DUF1610 family)
MFYVMYIALTRHCIVQCNKVLQFFLIVLSINSWFYSKFRTHDLNNQLGYYFCSECLWIFVINGIVNFSVMFVSLCDVCFHMKMLTEKIYNFLCPSCSNNTNAAITDNIQMGKHYLNSIILYTRILPFIN